jgi:GNAT superfamily N-acetyltransferase
MRDIAMKTKAPTDLQLRAASTEDLAFARELTRVNMRPYYAQYGLIWQPDAFDKEWAMRQTFVIQKAGKSIGFFGVTVEAGYLYVRDVQLIEPYRGEGIGTLVMQRIAESARNHGCTHARLKVFKSSPAIRLYLRQGYSVAGEEVALFWMECVV